MIKNVKDIYNMQKYTKYSRTIHNRIRITLVLQH